MLSKPIVKDIDFLLDLVTDEGLLGRHFGYGYDFEWECDAAKRMMKLWLYVRTRRTRCGT